VIQSFLVSELLAVVATQVSRQKLGKIFNLKSMYEACMLQVLISDGFKAAFQYVKRMQYFVIISQ